jgi:lipopolysaccharide transport system permease protein
MSLRDFSANSNRYRAWELFTIMTSGRFRVDALHGSVRRTVIQPRSGWQVIDWRELSAYRDLFFFLVWRDVRVLYKQTVMGFGWAIIRPLSSMLIFTIVFGRLAGMPSDGAPYALFTFVALVPWTYFSAAMTNSVGSLIASTDMLTKVYFPRLIIPATPVVAGLVDFIIAMVMLAVMMAVYGVVPTASIVFLPLLVAIMMLTAGGVGMWLSALAVQYRDVKHALQFLAQLMMYAAPVVWPVSLITDSFPAWGDYARLLYGLYPMAGVIEGFRAALLGTTAMPWDMIGAGAATALVLSISGAFYFRRAERIFADVA